MSTGVCRFPLAKYPDDVATKACSLAVVVSLFLATGCSFVAVRGPASPRPDINSTVECTSGRVAPLLDSVVGASLLSLGALGTLTSASCNRDPNSFVSLCPADKSSALTTSLVLAAVGGVYLWSALHGFNEVRECRDVLALQHECVAGNPAACQRFHGKFKDASVANAQPSPRTTSGSNAGTHGPVGVCVSDLDCVDQGGICYEGRCRALSR
jgi:hypothetical protein